MSRSYIDNPGPMVVFATPGMLHAGLSLTIFKRWCSDENNMIIMPGYCVAGTIGHKILNGTKRLEFEKGVTTEVKMSVQYMSFSAHADAKVSHDCSTLCSQLIDCHWLSYFLYHQKINQGMVAQVKKLGEGGYHQPGG